MKKAVCEKIGLLSFVSLTITTTFVVVCLGGVPLSVAVMVRLKCEVVSRSVWMEVVAISPVAELIEKCPKTSPPRTLGNKYLFVCLLVCLLASLVLMAKQELRGRFEYYFGVLREKHLEMEARLDEVVRVAETRVVDRQTQLNQLRITKAEVSQNLVHNKLNETLVNVSRELDEKIQGLEVIVDQVPSVWLEWRDEWLVGGMVELCVVCEGVSYVNRHNPVCSGVNRGKGQNELSYPLGLSTDRHNGDVYVCDSVADRIQVFSREGIHQRTISPQGLFDPFAITVTPHQLFVSCIIPFHLFKLDKLSGSILCSVKTEDIISGLSADTDTLYTGMRSSNQICHHSLEDLTTIRVTTLNSPHVTQHTTLDHLTTPLTILQLYSQSLISPTHTHNIP